MINEHDLNDMCRLYELNKGDKFKLVPKDVTGEEVRVPPVHAPVDLHAEYLFDHIDGIYSFCKNSIGEVVRFAAWTKVTKL
jgi:hypothetical protein